MGLRQIIESEVKKITGQAIPDDIFREAACEADKDIKFHRLGFGKKTNIDYIVYVMVTMVVALMKINKKSTLKSA